MGGISTNSGRVVFSTPSTDVLSRVSWNGAGAGPGGFVFGTLLGPETTGPCPIVLCWCPLLGVPAGGVGCGTCVFLVSWRCRSCTVVCGVWCMGLLFENYIVDASIFYKKQFPRI